MVITANHRGESFAWHDLWRYTVFLVWVSFFSCLFLSRQEKRQRARHFKKGAGGASVTGARKETNKYRGAPFRMQ